MVLPSSLAALISPVVFFFPSEDRKRSRVDMSEKTFFGQPWEMFLIGPCEGLSPRCEFKPRVSSFWLRLRVQELDHGSSSKILTTSALLPVKEPRVAL